MLKLTTVFLILFSLLACETTKDSYNSMEKKPQDPDKFMISGHIAEKEFIKKNGQPAGFTELYFRASVNTLEAFLKILCFRERDV